MNKKSFLLIISLFVCSMITLAQTGKSDLEQRADAEIASKHNINARALYVRAFEDYVAKGQTEQGVACGVKATTLYYSENSYQEAFELLRNIDQAIQSSRGLGTDKKAALRYQTSRERMNMYMRMHRSASVAEQLSNMENHAATANNDEVSNDLLYNKAIYYYSQGQTTKGNETFELLSSRMMNGGDDQKMDEAFRNVIATGRKAGNAYMVDQAYTKYIAWKDSVSAQKHAEEVAALNHQIDEGKASIAERDDKLSSRQTFIITLIVILVILAAVLVLGAIILLRFIMLTRKQKNTIRQANENNALKAKFISNISDQLNPTLQKLDSKQPAVKALIDFSDHIQTLSELDKNIDEPLESEETQIQPFCDGMIEKIRNMVKREVTLTVDAPKMSVNLYVPYVTHILQHLLENAAEFTPEGGHITLSFKKRGPRKYQFLVQNTGEIIPEEKREDVFKPFLEVRDLTQGDGLGLPICKQMAVKMNGDLDIDPAFVKGTRFVLHLEC